VIIWHIFFLFLQTKPSFSLCLPVPSWTFLLLWIQSLRCLKAINLTIVGFKGCQSGPRIFKLLNLCVDQLINIPYLLKGTVQPELRWVKIGINRAVRINCIAGTCHLRCPKGHHHERSINLHGDCSTF
jgi:hypothetical protein